jgi:hypothetical protein
VTTKRSTIVKPETTTKPIRRTKPQIIKDYILQGKTVSLANLWTVLESLATMPQEKVQFENLTHSLFRNGKRTDGTGKAWLDKTTTTQITQYLTESIRKNRAWEDIRQETQSLLQNAYRNFCLTNIKTGKYIRTVSKPEAQTLAERHIAIREGIRENPNATIERYFIRQNHTVKNIRPCSYLKGIYLIL